MKIFSLTLIILQLSFRQLITPVGSTFTPGNITQAYIGKYSPYIDDNVFERISYIIQSQSLPYYSMDQVYAIIRPIRQDFYQQAYSLINNELKLACANKPGCPDGSCLGSSEVQSLIVNILNSSLNGAFASINKEVSALMSTVDSSVPQPSNQIPPATTATSPAQTPPATTPAPPVKTSAPPAKNPTLSVKSRTTPTTETPVAVESHGAPSFVSSIPAKAPGAPNLSRRTKRGELAFTDNFFNPRGSPESSNGRTRVVSSTYMPVKTPSPQPKAPLPPAKNVTLSVKTRAAPTTEALVAVELPGAPNFVSSIPARAPGAPNLARRSRCGEVAFEDNVLNPRGLPESMKGRPHAVSFIPEARDKNPCRQASSFHAAVFKRNSPRCPPKHKVSRSGTVSNHRPRSDNNLPSPHQIDIGQGSSPDLPETLSTDPLNQVSNGSFLKIGDSLRRNAVGDIQDSLRNDHNALWSSLKKSHKLPLN